jgi:hypothetical protein
MLVNESCPIYVATPVPLVVIVVEVTVSFPWNVPFKGTCCCAAAGTARVAVRISAAIGR